MHDDRILNVNMAAKLVHAAPDTLLQYIRRGELPAARLGKHMIIVYDDLVAFVRMIAARQTSARVEINEASDQSHGAPAETNRQPATTTFVFTPAAIAPAGQCRGRRKPLPQLPPDSI